MPSTQVLKALPNHQEGQERGPGASQLQLDLWEGNGANNLENNLEEKKIKEPSHNLGGGQDGTKRT